jgi:hypothetical protein
LQIQRSPNILLILGTSAVAHLREHRNAVTLALPENVLAEQGRRSVPDRSE